MCVDDDFSYARCLKLVGKWCAVSRKSYLHEYVDASQKNINEVVEALSAFATVELDYDKAQVSIIGKNIGGNSCMLKEIFTPLEEHTVYMVSQGASYINVSLVVDKTALKQVVQSVHDLLFFQAQMYDYIRYNGY